MVSRKGLSTEGITILRSQIIDKGGVVDFNKRK